MYTYSCSFQQNTTLASSLQPLCLSPAFDTALVWSAANSGVVQHTDQGVGQDWRGRRGACCDDEHAQCRPAARHHQLGWPAACPHQSCTAWQVSVLLCSAIAELSVHAACMSAMAHPIGCTGYLMLLKYVHTQFGFEDISSARCWSYSANNLNPAQMECVDASGSNLLANPCSCCWI